MTTLSSLLVLMAGLYASLLGHVSFYAFILFFAMTFVIGGLLIRPALRHFILNSQEKIRLFEAAIVNAKDAVIITDADLCKEGPRIVFVNHAFTKLSGYEKEEVIGKRPSLFYGPRTDKNTLKKMRETLEEGQAFQCEITNYHKSGKLYWSDISIYPVRDDHGVVTHYAAFKRDVTERKAFEMELRVNREAAQVASRAKSDFLANMSHELRTPMNGIIGLTELLIDMNLNEDQTELAEAVNSSSRNLLILLNDILDLSKIEGGELTLENIPFLLHKSINETVDLLSPLASRKGVIIEKSINPLVPKGIISDPSRFQQILNNLISNAIKFTEEGYVKIDVSSSVKGEADMLHIRVEDTGIGIPDEKQDMIFSKFTQADVTTARKYGGTGLGLAITKQLTEMMGGDIRLNSMAGKGTTFYVDLPLRIAADQDLLQERHEKKSHLAQNASDDAKLLVVDDHPVNLLFMRKVLKKLGFQNVDEARSGKEAMQALSENIYDLVFMDCQMPEMDGFEASERVRLGESLPENEDVKIIAITADAMKGAREKCLDAGMNDYISKPVDTDKLICVLGEWLPVKKTHEKNKEKPQQKTPSLASDIILDIERFRMFTDDDPDEEKALIEMFETYAEDSILTLTENLETHYYEIWQKAAHKLKGSAANLGAYILSEICLEAETSYTNDSSVKKNILNRILAAYKDVRHEFEAIRKVETS